MLVLMEKKPQHGIFKDFRFCNTFCKIINRNINIWSQVFTLFPQVSASTGILNSIISQWYKWHRRTENCGIIYSLLTTMFKLSTILLSLARHLLYDIEKELCNCCVRLLSNCFMDSHVCSTQLKSKFVLTPGVDRSNVHWGTISFGKNGQESIKFIGLHR